MKDVPKNEEDSDYRGFKAAIDRLASIGIRVYGFDPGVSCTVNNSSLYFASIEWKILDFLLQNADQQVIEDLKNYVKKGFTNE